MKDQQTNFGLKYAIFVAVFGVLFLISIYGLFTLPVLIISGFGLVFFMLGYIRYEAYVIINYLKQNNHE